MNMKQGNILIVDDEQLVRRLLSQKLTSEGYQCKEASNADEALATLRSNHIELVLLDIKMPGMSGVELLPEIKAGYPYTAVIMATAITDTGIAIQCMREGAYDYLVKPFNMDEVAINASRALEKRRLVLENRTYQHHLEEMVAERTKKLKHAINKIRLSSLDTIHRLARAAEYKDEDTGDHIKRMSQYSASIARKMGLSNQEVENILYAAPMHDVGKIGIPDRILLKPGKLDNDEWEIMKKHTAIGAEILQGSDAEFIRLAEMIAFTHHEKWDGTGYPKGLRGEDIPIAGRIVAIADVFDALTSNRPYKPPYPVKESLDIIIEGSGKHFDPDIVGAFFGIKNEILSTKEKYKDEQ